MTDVIRADEKELRGGGAASEALAEGVEVCQPECPGCEEVYGAVRGVNSSKPASGARGIAEARGG